jgi:hypothetical protein
MISDEFASFSKKRDRKFSSCPFMSHFRERTVVKYSKRAFFGGITVLNKFAAIILGTLRKKGENVAFIE